MSTVQPPTCSGRHFLTMTDYSAEEIRYLIDLSAELKAAKREGREEQRLAGKEIALIFEKDSTRTRCAFEVAAYDQGAHVTFIGPSGSHMGHKETVKDTARVLGRMYDAIEYRGFGEAVADELAQWAGVPGLQRAHRRMAPDADARRLPDHARAPRQALRARCATATSATPASTWPTATSRSAPNSAWTSGSPRPARCGPTRSSSRLPRLRRRVRRQDHHHRETSPKPSATATSCSPTSGSRWASPTTSGPNASSC